MDYLAVKTLHIVCSVLLVGTGFGSAFFLYMTHRSGSVPAIAMVSRLVVRADWWFTTPTVILQPLTGGWMMHLAGWPLSGRWIETSLGLHALAGACWIPVVILQIRMARLADTALRLGTPLTPDYWRLARTWERLGYPAFTAMLIIYWLMVTKPG